MPPTTDHFQLTNAFTVDVEDYFQVSAFDSYIDRNQWDGYESRVQRNTRRLLELLDRRQVRGTFFVLGWVASRYPDLVREIHARGHEIGSHSYWHRLVYQQTPDEFRCDLRQSRDVLEQLIGEPITVYRAPSFSITRQSQWALEILVEEGFLVDSSIVPIRHDRYGIPGASRHIHQIDTPSGPLIEFPPSVYRTASFNLPVGGGGYFRLYPIAFTRYCLSRTLARTNQPFMFYTHPWEIDDDQPRLTFASRLSRFRHYVNLRWTEAKLEKLLQSFRFAPLREVLRSIDSCRLPVPSTVA